MSEPTQREAHRRFLNGFYGVTRHFYDPSRKYYLFGRDVALRGLLAEPWSTLVEVGVGTGRNLRLLHEGRPDARLGGLDASDEMLAHVGARAPWARLARGFAEDADLTAVLGERPDRILFSYCLSMVQDVGAALTNARAHLAPGGKLIVVDFADFATMPAVVALPFRHGLKAAHVYPLDTTQLESAGLRLRFGPFHYYVIGEAAAPPAA